MSFDISMAIFFWIEFWCVGWQILDMDLRMFLQKCFHNLGSMGARAIPDQDERALDVAQQMLQSDQQFFSIDRAIRMSFLDLASHRQSSHCRGFPAKLGNSFQLRGLAFRCPGEADWFGIGNPKFIFKYDLCAEPVRLFLSLANPAPTRLGSSLHLSQSLWDLVFAHSSPNHPTNG